MFLRKHFNVISKHFLSAFLSNITNTNTVYMCIVYLLISLLALVAVYRNTVNYDDISIARYFLMKYSFVSILGVYMYIYILNWPGDEKND